MTLESQDTKKINVLLLLSGFAFVASSVEGLVLNDPNLKYEVSAEGGNDQTADLFVGCTCDNMACACGTVMKGNLGGNQIYFKPNMEVEFIDKNVSLSISAKDGDKVLMTRSISGEDYLPVVCVPIPQFPFIQFCVKFKNLTVSVENKTIGVCPEISVNTVPVGLPVYPHMNIGCFSATVGKGLTYIPPEIEIPGMKVITDVGNNLQENSQLVNINLPTFPNPVISNLNNDGGDKLTETGDKSTDSNDKDS